MAKNLIEENKGYIPEDIAKEAIEEINKNQKKKTTTDKATRKKKGA